MVDLADPVRWSVGPIWGSVSPCFFESWYSEEPTPAELPPWPYLADGNQDLDVENCSNQVAKMMVYMRETIKHSSNQASNVLINLS